MSIRDLALLAALHAAMALVILLAGMAAGRADPIAWRIEVRACRADACRTLPASTRQWDARFACERRAERIAAFADLSRLLPAGNAVRARCRPVDGLRGA